MIIILSLYENALDVANLMEDKLQMKHCIPTTKQTKPLFGSGVEKTLPYILSDTFVFKAKKNGYIESIDEKNEIAILRYNDGTSDIIDLSESLAKNSGGGCKIMLTLNFFNCWKLLLNIGQSAAKH